MRVSLTRIGNSKGIRIPKSVLEECNFSDEAELEIKKGTIVISPVVQVRDGWSDAADILVKAEEVEWEW